MSAFCGVCDCMRLGMLLYGRGIKAAFMSAEPPARHKRPRESVTSTVDIIVWALNTHQSNTIQEKKAPRVAMWPAVYQPSLVKRPVYFTLHLQTRKALGQVGWICCSLIIILVLVMLTSWVLKQHMTLLCC